MGNDFNFTNVESQVLCENRYFDGTSYIDTGIKLFDADSPSFTLAIDFESCMYKESNNTPSYILSCQNTQVSGSLVFSIVTGKASHPSINWRDA